MPYCTQCGAENATGYKFCIQCGKPSDAVASSIPASPSPPVQPQAAAPQPPTFAQPAAPPFDFGRWFGKNKTWLLPSVAILVIGILVYQLFLKPNPGKEGKALAVKECSCREEKVTEETSLKNEFLSKFTSYGFADAMAAQNRYDSIRVIVNENAAMCEEVNSELQTSYRKKFTKPDDIRLFLEGYYEASSDCKADNNDVAEIDSKVYEKIQELHQQMQVQETQQREDAYRRTLDSIKNVNDSIVTSPPVEAGDINAEAIISSFYTQENAITNEADIEALLNDFEFPVARYYNARNVDRVQMAKFYTASYIKLLSRHRVYGFENGMQTETLPDGSRKVIVSSTFEFATQSKPDEIKTRTTNDVFILTPSGKIKSVYTQ